MESRYGLRAACTPSRSSITCTSNYAAGVELTINRYDEYGVSASTNVGRFQFTGQTWVPEVNLYYFKARFYSASIGRFMQTDPVGYAAGMNLYGYVGGDPINRSDPLGLQEEEISGDVIVGGTRPDWGCGYDCTSFHPSDFFQDFGFTQRNVDRWNEAVENAMAQPQQNKSLWDKFRDAQCKASASAWIALSYLGPAQFSTANERMLVHRYFEGPPSGHHLSSGEFSEAGRFIAESPGLVVNQSAPDANGVYTAQVNFGNYFGRGGGDSLDGLLGTATATFQNGALIGISDTFNFDHKSRGSLLISLPVDLMRLSAATNCRNPGGFSITGSR